ncbi:MAG: ATP-binding protein [Caldilineaceae bacterium]|nr:ATP-binding protein [Caldilineaceae bacterium]
MKGHPATGKSSLASGLATALGWPLLDKDDIKDHTLRLADGNQLAYTILWQLVETQLRLGLNVIADSPLSYPADYARCCALASHYQSTLLVVETRLDEPLWRARLEARSAQPSLHKVASWPAMQTLLARYDGCWNYPIGSEQHLVVDTGRSAEHCIAQAMNRIEGKNEQSDSCAASAT